jgi:hypothetical protein
MNAIGTYFWTFGAEIAAALGTKAYDPIAWLALMGALVLGAFSNPRRPWWGALGWGALTAAVLTLEATYLASPVPRGDSAALGIVCVIGVVAGHRLRLWFTRRSAHPT